jgi:hypothetical protein
MARDHPPHYSQQRFRPGARETILLKFLHHVRLCVCVCVCVYYYSTLTIGTTVITTIWRFQCFSISHTTMIPVKSGCKKRRMDFHGDHTSSFIIGTAVINTHLHSSLRCIQGARLDLARPDRQTEPGLRPERRAADSRINVWE